MKLHYAIRPAHAGAHLFHVTVTVERPSSEGQLFMLPAWIPGSYMIREFARNIVQVAALAGDERVPVDKLDKHTWRVPALGDFEGPLTLAYEVYAWDLSVRAALLDTTLGFFNASSVFLLPVGWEDARIEVDILPPAGEHAANWRVATGLAPARGTKRHAFGTYTARDYDELIDCPVLMGEFALARFEVLGTPHEIAIAGRAPDLDLERLSADLTRVCAEQIALFEPRTKRAPFERYTFMTLAVGEGYGGLEHRNSTALICRREDLPYRGMAEPTEGYRRFLGLASHEYFHAWNVKRIRPAAFVPYALERENYTRLLWLFEGFTSYYDDLTLARAGLITRAQYLGLLAKNFNDVLGASGRRKQSLAESSFDAWIKYYRQDENSPNAIVSYYQKGALIALALDLLIRARSGGKRSLDDLMRLLWARHTEAGEDYAGVHEEEIAELITEATGLTLDEELAAWTEGTADPDFAALLEPFGIRLATRAQPEPAARALLGLKLAPGAEPRIAQVYDGGAAQDAGLAAGDLLVALDGLRVTPASLDAQLRRRRAGQRAEVLAFRRDELLRFEPTLIDSAPAHFELLPEDKPGGAAKKLQRGWLG
jgi:predicted metalloprotease with PDZ domain